jgi:hypothetical protein
MNQEPELDDRSIDDELAEFTDRVLSQDPEEAREPATQHPQLRALEEIVIALRRLLPSNEPDPETANRIQAHLNAEWQRSKMHFYRVRPQKQEPIRHPLAWLKQFLTQNRERRYALSFALLAVILVVVVWLLAPGLDVDLTATAGGGTNLLPFILILVILAIAALVVFFRSRR